MRIHLNDKMFRGLASFEEYEDHAVLAFRGRMRLPIGSEYTLNGITWRVTEASPSNYIPNVINVRLEKLNG